MFGPQSVARARGLRTPSRAFRTALGPALLALLTLPLSGCCAVASWACGPDRSAWISVDRSSPELALATFREALRRESQRETFFSLSESLKSRVGVVGLVEWQIAWDRIREEFPSLFILGEAEVIDSEREPDGRHRFDLTIAGERLRVRFRPQLVSLVEIRNPNGTTRQAGSFLAPADLGEVLTIPRGEEPRIALSLARVRAAEIDSDPQLVDGELQAHINPADLVRAGIHQEWKLDDFGPVDGTVTVDG